MEIIYRGAESIIYFEKLDGDRVIVKERLPKKYRIPQLDEKLRKERIRKEVKLLTEVRKLGVETPKILKVDEENSRIIMEYVDGITVKNLLNSSNKKDIKIICNNIGRVIGKLHQNNIFHGDLTTSNMIVKGDKIYFIDFGLGGFSRRLEDKGVDMKLLLEALKSTHFKILKPCWSNILKGYKQEYKDANSAIEKVDEIERRARYKERV